MGFLRDGGCNLKILDFCLRFFVIPVTVASIWLTISNQQSNSDYGVLLSFTDFKGLQYTVAVSAASCGYALFTAVALWVTSLVSKPWFFFVSDQVIAYLLVTSMSALAEILYLVYHGDQGVTWSEACTSYGKFCDRLKLVFVLLAIALCCFIVLAAISAFRVFSRYDFPSDPSKELEEEPKC
ncbi:PREDICTED: CASP-like protein 2D1 [Ipomoea nil]|uniref:CASP-like protein 2D1 n=1 Tax=Ipomoea nil TaxID=35883 RepID=UPI0009015A39|nr:PREDICTED: CASP-like protein 2D1 [Ipomoea nil]